MFRGCRVVANVGRGSPHCPCPACDCIEKVTEGNSGMPAQLPNDAPKQINTCPGVAFTEHLDKKRQLAYRSAWVCTMRIVQAANQLTLRFCARKKTVRSCQCCAQWSAEIIMLPILQSQVFVELIVVVDVWMSGARAAKHTRLCWATNDLSPIGMTQVAQQVTKSHWFIIRTVWRKLSLVAYRFEMRKIQQQHREEEIPKRTR